MLLHYPLKFENVTDFCHLWQPNSPDVNAVDYQIWITVQQ